jgi:hypothetical protein
MAYNVLNELFSKLGRRCLPFVLSHSELKATPTVSYSDLSTPIIRVPDSLKLIKIIDYFYGYWHAQQVLLF